MIIKCRTLSFSLIFVIILNTVNLISHQHHCQYRHHQQPYHQQHCYPHHCHPHHYCHHHHCHHHYCHHHPPVHMSHLRGMTLNGRKTRVKRMATAEMNPWMSVIVRVMMMMRLLLLSTRVTVKRRFLSILLVVHVHELAGYLYLIRAT